MSISKILWVVQYDDLGEFLNQATAIDATGVAIRTDNDLAKAVAAGHKKGLQVFGWRWPSAKRDPAMKEAAKVVALLSQGLDGYFVDPEGAPGQPWDWNQKGLASLATDFCKAVAGAAKDKAFGVTSHYRADKVFPDLPWQVFFNYCNVFLPQAYWRSTEGVIGHGLPDDNYRAAIDFWTKAGADVSLIKPIAGEIACATAAEINLYAKAVADRKADEQHFYSYTPEVKASVWNAIAKS